MSTETVTPPVQDPPAPPPPSGKTYTQAELDAAVEARLTGAIREATKRTKAEIEQEAAGLKERLAKYETKELEEKGRYAESLKLQEKSLLDKYEPQLKERDERIHALTGVVRDRTVKSVLVSAAAAANAVNPAEIARLLDSEIELDDQFNPSVMQGKAQRFVNGAAMTPEQRVAEYLQQNPHHVKATQTAPGGGAGGGASRTGGDPSEAALLEAEIKKIDEEYRRTKDTHLLTRHREATNQLRALRAKAA